MAKESKDKHFIKKPIYPGGNEAMKAFIKKHLAYPKAALNKKIEGTVVLRYDIDYKGNVTAGKIISSLGYGCDEEAIRVIKLLKFMIPKEPYKMRLTFHKTTRIHFRLPKTKQTQIQYTYTNKASKSSRKSTGSGSYHYTINI